MRRPKMATALRDLIPSNATRQSVSTVWLVFDGGGGGARLSALHHCSTGRPAKAEGNDADQSTEDQSSVGDRGGEEGQPCPPEAAATVGGVGGGGRPRSLAARPGGETGVGLHQGARAAEP